MFRWLPAVILLLGGVGCGDQRYVPVSGTVTYNGKPLPKVQVMFQPLASGGVDAGGVGSFALTDDNGKFSLQAATSSPTGGALVGKHQVRIAFPPQGGTVADNDSDAANPGKGKGIPKLATQPIPEKYNTESTLTFEVPPGGTSKADFQLEGPPLDKTKK